jgi:protein-S-isoprenylcysteine O-methyltransferase Ste14
MTPQLGTLIAWGVFLISWIAAAFWADRTEKRPARREEWLYRGLTAVGAYLLFRGGVASASATYRIWALWAGGDWAMFALLVAGLAFVWWARLHLGRLWSSSVTKKADHRVVDTGPYGVVRHPIYTGLLLSLAATAGQLGTAYAVAGVLFFLAASGSRPGWRNASCALNSARATTTPIAVACRCYCLWAREDKARAAGTEGLSLTGVASFTTPQKY